jgi:hypothetical protein
VSTTDYLAQLPARVVRTTGPRAGHRSYILDSQAAANAACEQVGWVTIHPQRSTTTRSTTMTNTTPPTVKLSCNHTAVAPGHQPAIGDKVVCSKCPTKSGQPAIRSIKAVTPAKGAPVGTPLATEAHDRAQDEARHPATDDRPDAEVIQFPDRLARQAAAKAAAKAVRDGGGTPSDAGKASDAVMATPIAQATVTDRSDTSHRAPVGRITFLNLSASRRAALLEALGDAEADVHDDEADAAQAIKLVLADEAAKRVDLDAAGVRVLIRNLRLVEAGAARKAEAWLDKFAEAAGYSG